MENYVGKVCPACGQPIAEGEAAFCGSCGTPHHRACWLQTGCRNPACAGKAPARRQPAAQPPQYQQPAQPFAQPVSPAPQPVSPAIPFEKVKEDRSDVLFPLTRLLLRHYGIVKDLNNNESKVSMIFRQYAGEKIRSVLMDLHCLDAENNETAVCENVLLIDLQGEPSVDRVGSLRTALPDPDCKAVRVSIKHVVYENGGSESIREDGEILPAPVPLESRFEDPLLAQQYARETTPKAKWVPFAEKTVRFCCCGACFGEETERCPACGTAFAEAVERLEPAPLREALAAFQAAEAERAAQLAEQQAEEQRRIEEAQRLSEERARQKAEEIAAAEAERKKKKSRRTKIIVGSVVGGVAAVGLTVASILFFIPLLRYTLAKKNVENGEFDKAIETFEALDGFRDSEELAVEAKYQKAVFLAENERYAEARTVFEELGDYEDSAKRANTCGIEADYQEAVRALENGEYETAAKLFDSLKGKKKDVETQAQEAHYLYAKALLDKKDYKNAVDQFVSAGDYRDAADQLKEARYQYGAACLKNKAYKEAYETFSLIKTYKDVPEKYKEASYQYGRILLNNKSWLAAVKIFGELGAYEDSKDRLNEAKYGYVLSNKSNTDSTTYQYLKELRAADYKDSAAVYDSLYAWSVQIVINDSESNSTTQKSSIGRYSNIYCHVSLSGGPPGGSTKLSYSSSWPDGNRSSGSWEGTWSSGTTGSCYFWYNNPAYGATGTFTVTIYDGDGNRLGSGSVQITY